MDWEPGAHANTFGGNPLACVAALETIALLESKLMHNAAVVGKYLLSGLEKLSRRFLSIGDARGLGLMCAIEIVKSRATKEPAPDLRDRIVQGAFERGLLLLPCGETSIRFSPPLIASKKDVDTALNVLEDVFSRL